MILNLLKLLIIWFLNLFFKEKFTVEFKDYSDKVVGYCKPGLTIKEFQSGNYSTCCWSNMSFEDCQTVNKSGLFCGRNLDTGDPVLCYHVHNKPCKNDPICFGSCNPQVGFCNGPYMIPVKSRNVIGLEKK